MHPPGADTVVVRYGDASTKSRRVRADMERQLGENVEALLSARGLPGDLELRPTRPLIHVDDPDAVAPVAETAAEAFGVVSTSPARTVPSEMDAITDALAETARARYDGGSFAVDARRAGEHSFTSEDVQVEGGSAVWNAVDGEFDPEVDLDDPDVTFAVEVRPEEAFVTLDSIPGPGGLPLGSQAPVVALLSGGIDSPVAAYEIMRRGSPAIPVYVDLGDYGGPDHEARAMETARLLAEYAPNHDLRPFRVPAGETVALLADTMAQGRMLAFRRFLLRVAEHVADEVGAHGIVTGEALGQKSSQTARNLRVTSAASDLPVHRPLLTWDKQDIVDRAREIGTFRDSTIPAGCDRFAPDQAETYGRLSWLEDAEPDDLFERAARAAARARRVDLPDPPDAS